MEQGVTGGAELTSELLRDCFDRNVLPLCIVSFELFKRPKLKKCRCVGEGLI